MVRHRALAAPAIRAEPLCRICMQRDIVTPATVADHVEPHHGDRHKFETGELQSVCVE